MRFLFVVVNGLVAGNGAWAYLNAETWAGSMVVVLIAGGVILYGDWLRRTVYRDRI